MTGGIGFSRDSSNTQKKNRNLLGFRKSNAENPYWGNKRVKRKRIIKFAELLNFKKNRTSSIKPELCDRVRDEALSHNKSGSLDSKA
ncbi:MAG: hypothetical protein L3J29_03560 [Cyclobacteriaceae bacterium]|nr:hypothetical protein [Cyclobacteriaceae bacterium]